jgi:hypothetical protein
MKRIPGTGMGARPWSRAHCPCNPPCKHAMQWSLAAGVVGGDGDGCLEPGCMVSVALCAGDFMR